MQAIVAFTFEKNISEDWNWIFNDVSEKCATTNMIVYQATPGSQTLDRIFQDDPDTWG